MKYKSLILMAVLVMAANAFSIDYLLWSPITEVEITSHSDGDIVFAGSTINLACTTSTDNDCDDRYGSIVPDSVTHYWTAGSGSFSPSTGTSVSWTAPSTTGNVTITVTADDNYGSDPALYDDTAVSDAVTLTVQPASQVSTPLSEVSITSHINDQRVVPGQQYTLTCSSVTDNDLYMGNTVSDSVNYIWEVSDGSLSSNSGTSVVWTAPELLKKVTVKVTADDAPNYANDAAVSETITLKVHVNASAFFAVSDETSFLIDSNDCLWSTGEDDRCQLGAGTYKDDRSVFGRVLDGDMASSSGYLESIVKVVGSHPYALAIDDNNQLYGWGEKQYITLGGTSFFDEPKKAKYNSSQYMDNIIDIATSAQKGLYGYNFSLALDDNGNVWAWGKNSVGQLGVGTQTAYPDPTVIYPVKVHDGEQTPGISDYLEDIIQVACGDDTGFALTSGGNVFAWGGAYLGNGSSNSSLTPVKVHDGEQTPGISDYLEDIAAISAAGNTCFALDNDGCVWAWGSNSFNLLGQNKLYNCSIDEVIYFSTTPMKVHKNSTSEYLDNIEAIAAGPEHCLALDDQGYVWFWGNECNVGDMMSTYSTSVPVAKRIDPSYLSNIVSINASDDVSTAIDSSGNVYVWSGALCQNSGLGDAYYLTSRISLPIQLP